MTTYTLRDLVLANEESIHQILTFFNHPLSNDKTLNTLSTIILSYNFNILSKSDRKYVESPYFTPLFQTEDLTPFLNQYNLLPTGDRIDQIKAILDTIFNNITANVVSVDVKSIRPEYENLKAWMKDPQNIYIGRGGVVFIEFPEGKRRFPPTGSIWANPFKPKPKDPSSLASSLDQYRDYIIQKLKSGEIPRSELEKLRGKNIGCWCKRRIKGKICDAPCHGDILVELLKNPSLYS